MVGANYFGRERILCCNGRKYNRRCSEGVYTGNKKKNLSMTKKRFMITLSPIKYLEEVLELKNNHCKNLRNRKVYAFVVSGEAEKREYSQGSKEAVDLGFYFGFV